MFFIYLGLPTAPNDMRKYGGKFFMLGLTATPFRTDEEETGGWMKKVFPDDILYRISISDLISRNILSQPHFERKNTDLDMKKLFEDNNATDVYNRIIHNKKFDIGGAGKDAKRAAALIAGHHKRNAFIVETYKNNAAKYGKTLVFALNQAMAKVLYEYFQAAGVRVGCVISSYGSYANEQTIKKFKNDEIDVLVNVNIVTEGVDVPNVQTVFLTRPTKSKILMTQMIGRGLRGKKVGGTEITYIVDFLDNWRDDLVAWVIPEKLYDEEAKEILEVHDDIYDIDLKKLSDLEILRAISEDQLAEFIRLANSKFDLSLFKEFSLIERIPLGYYYFDYEVSGDDREGEVKTCTVLVYDCMKAKFDELFDWLKNRADKKFFDIGIDAAADEIDEKFFGVREELLAYDKENIRDILRFYVQNDCNLLPQFVEFDKRAEYDLSPLVQQVADKDFIETMKIIENAWSTDDKWKQLFGEKNNMAFISAITAEVAKKAGLLKKPINELTDEDIKTAENVPLDVLVVRHPEIYEKICDAVYKNYHDANGFYSDEQKNNLSKYRLDFEIEYKTPRSSGGKTLPDNLKLVYTGSSLSNLAYKHMPLSEIQQKDSVLYKKICDAVYRDYQLRDGKYFDGQTPSKRSDDKDDF